MKIAEHELFYVQRKLRKRYHKLEPELDSADRVVGRAASWKRRCISTVMKYLNSQTSAKAMISTLRVELLIPSQKDQ